MIISATPLEPDAQAVLDEAADTEPESELRPFTIDVAQHGERLDRALAQLVPEFSRSYLQQLIEAGAVQFGGRQAIKPALRVRAGDRGTVELRPTPQSEAFRPEAMALEILFQDDHLLVVNKPAGLVVHPAPGNWSGTLLNGLLAHDEAARTLPRAGIVHRLDKDTSGLMVVARSRGAMDALVQAIAARTVARQYLALGQRPWSGPKRRDVDAPIGRDPRNRLRMGVVDLERQGGKPAFTSFELMDNAADGCLVRATLRTGRTHQIRVHMASIGHPLLADAIYGGAPGAGMHRQALHAFRLAFAHPASGEALEFIAPPPTDLEQAMVRWGLRYNGPQWLMSHAPG